VGKVIEYTLVSRDGVFADEGIGRFFEPRVRCDADGSHNGREFFQALARARSPWADRLNAMPKYVFSSKLENAAWNNSTIVRGDVVAEVTRLKQQDGGNLLIYGHGLLAETLLRQRLIDAIDLSIYPIVLGRGKLFFREDQHATLRLVAAKAFARGIVKLTYEPDYAGEQIG